MPNVPMVEVKAPAATVQDQLPLGAKWHEVWGEDGSRSLDPNTSPDAIQAWLPLQVSSLSVFFHSTFSRPGKTDG